MTKEEANKAMDLALSEAEQALSEGEIPVGAVLLMNGKPFCSAHNRREQDADPTAHAEILVIRQAARQLGSWHLDGLELVVTLEPCAMCAGAIAASRLSHVIFGAFDTSAGCCGSVYALTEDPSLHTCHVNAEGGFREAECRKLLSRFFENKR